MNFEACPHINSAELCPTIRALHSHEISSHPDRRLANQYHTVCSAGGYGCSIKREIEQDVLRSARKLEVVR